MLEPLGSEPSVPARTTVPEESAATDAGEEADAGDGGNHRDPAAPLLAASLDRWLPVLAIAAMIATFLILPPSYAMTLVALIWLVGTRLSASRRLLGLTLTEALAWVATVAIVAFLSLVLIFVLGGAGGSG